MSGRLRKVYSVVSSIFENEEVEKQQNHESPETVPVEIKQNRKDQNNEPGETESLDKSGKIDVVSDASTHLETQSGDSSLDTMGGWAWSVEYSMYVHSASGVSWNPATQQYGKICCESLDGA